MASLRSVCGGWGDSAEPVVHLCDRDHGLSLCQKNRTTSLDAFWQSFHHQSDLVRSACWPPRQMQSHICLSCFSQLFLSLLLQASMHAG